MSGEASGVPAALSSACSSYRSNQLACADGFIQRYSCWGKPSCEACGFGKYGPYCLMDELPAHMVRDDGSPGFYAQPETPAREQTS